MKLLIVEDSTPIAERLCQALASIPGLTLALAGGCTTAGEQLQEWQPQLVILDIGLSDGDGLELLRRIKRETPAIRVLMFSNHADFRAHCLREGADAFFDKAVDFPALIASVRILAGDAA